LLATSSPTVAFPAIETPPTASTGRTGGNVNSQGVGAGAVTAMAVGGSVLVGAAIYYQRRRSAASAASGGVGVADSASLPTYDVDEEHAAASMAG
jgi:hypothetical protein